MAIEPEVLQRIEELRVWQSVPGHFTICGYDCEYRYSKAECDFFEWRDGRRYLLMTLPENVLVFFADMVKKTQADMTANGII